MEVAATLSDDAALMPTFDVQQRGAYVAELIVNDGSLDSVPDTVVITTLNSPPAADAGEDQSPFVLDPVVLDGSGSTDVDGDMLSFRWAFVSKPVDSMAELSTPDDVSTGFVVDAAGEYIVQLIVNDGTVDSDPDTVVLVTQNSAPVADAGPDQSVAVPTDVTLDGMGSDDVDGDPLAFSWSLTTKPPLSDATLSGEMTETPAFTVDVPGDYVAQLIVNDGTVDSAPDTVMVTTLNVASRWPRPGRRRPCSSTSSSILDGSFSSDADSDTT